MNTRNKRINATEFMAKCLKILDELESQGVVIAKRGHPVARLTPLHEVDNSKLIGADEIIAATSIVENIPLLTRDRRIRKSRIVPLAI